MPPLRGWVVDLHSPTAYARGLVHSALRAGALVTLGGFGTTNQDRDGPRLQWRAIRKSSMALVFAVPVSTLSSLLLLSLTSLTSPRNRGLTGLRLVISRRPCLPFRARVA